MCALLMIWSVRCPYCDGRLVQVAGSEFQSGLSGRLGPRGDAAMKFVLTAVKSDLRHAGRQGPLGKGRTYLGCRFTISPVIRLPAQLFIQRAHTGESSSLLVVNDLGIHVFVASEELSPL